MGVAIKVENLSKAYQLGTIGTDSLGQDLKRLSYLIRGKEDPFLKIGETNDRTTKGESNMVWSLKDVNFEIEQGDAVGIIGRNGAGKSTLLKILSRVTSPTTGSVKLKGRVASLLEVGTGFHPELTGRENIFLNGAILGMRKAEIKKHFDAIVDFAGVERYIDTPVKRYSSGMYVRLAFAVAAHLESEILIVDEVLAVGDAEFQKKCLGKMNEVREGEGRTVLFVSHNMGSIEALCNKSFILNNGSISFSGDTQEAITNYITINNGKLDNQNEIFTDTSYRNGSGDIQVTSIEFKDMEENSLNAIPAGKSIQIVLKFINNFPDKNYTLIPGIAIKSALGTNICLHHSRLEGKVYNKLPKTGEFRFILKNIPLVPTVYRLSYSLVNENVIMDSISATVPFIVIESNYYGFGEIVPSASALVLLEGEWILNK